VEHIAGDEHEIRPERYRLIDCAPERMSDVCLPLIEARGSESLILTKAEMKVGEMNESHDE